MKNSRFWKILSDKIRLLTTDGPNGKSVYSARFTHTEMNELLKYGVHFETFHAMQANYVHGCMKRGDSFKSTYTFTVPSVADFFFVFLPKMRNEFEDDSWPIGEYNLTN